MLCMHARIFIIGSALLMYKSDEFNLVVFALRAALRLKSLSFNSAVQLLYMLCNAGKMSFHVSLSKHRCCRNVSHGKQVDNRICNTELINCYKLFKKMFSKSISTIICVVFKLFNKVP